MPAFQMLECMVALAGDDDNIVHRSADNPVTYPELLVLQYVHGADAVSDVHELGTEERDNQDELDRLRRTYNAAAVKDVFPGANPRLPLTDKRFKPRTAPTPPKRNIAPPRADRDVDGLAPGE
jgi:hypothetical protein